MEVTARRLADVFSISTNLYQDAHFIYIWTYSSFLSLSDNRSIAFSNTSSPQSAVKCLLFRFPTPSRFLRSSSSCLRLLPRLIVTSVFPSITCLLLPLIAFFLRTIMIYLCRFQIFEFYQIFFLQNLLCVCMLWYCPALLQISQCWIINAGTLNISFRQITFSVVDICEITDRQIYKCVVLHSKAEISLTFVLVFYRISLIC